MISIDFTKLRAQRSRDAQNTLANPPAPGTPWLGEKTILQWDTEITLLDQSIIAESQKRTQLRNAAAYWQTDVDLISRIIKQVAALGAVHFRKDPRRHLFEGLTTDARSRTDIYADGLSARDAWQEADPAWVVRLSDTESWNLGAFGSLLSSCDARQRTHSAKFQAWRLTASTVNDRAEALDQDCIAWYEEATRIFHEGTVLGDMIRTTVPTTTRTPQPVGPAAITSVMASGTDLHLDIEAEHATKFTYLHQAPGSPIFVVVVTDSPSNQLTLHGQAPGVHRVKGFGSNSGGDGPESPVAEITIAQQAAA